MQKIKTEWHSQGQDRQVTTTREPFEDVDAWIARHQTAVADAMETYPPE